MMEYRARFRGSPSSVRSARAAVVDYSRLCGFETRELEEIALAVGEALANAVEHGSRDLGFIDVSCSFENETLSIFVADSGIGFDVDRILARRPDPTTARGFGISIMRSVMDDVRFEKDGAVVKLRKQMPASASKERQEEA